MSPKQKFPLAASAILCTLMLIYIQSAAPTPASMNADAVIQAEVQALNEGNAAAVLALFAPDAKVFSVPEDRDQLVGAPSDTMSTHEQRQSFFAGMLSRRPLSRVELLDSVSAGDLVVAKLRFSTPPDASRPAYLLVIYRIRDGLIRNLWHVARSSEDATTPAQQAEAVVHSFAAANNRGDVEAFLGLFSPKAKNFRNSGDPHALGDKPSTRMVDEQTRRAAYLKMFANGAPAQVQTLGTVALGDMIAAREAAVLPNGKTLDEISMYHIENGLILRDWFIYNEARP